MQTLFTHPHIQVLGCALAMAAFTGLPAIAQDHALEGGSIGVEQVERGQEEYMANCSSCHGEDLHSVLSTAPDLTGSVFKYGWVGQTVGAKYNVISTTMPAGMGGSLSDQTYVDIVAYILSANGVSATQDGELPADPEALQAITITAP
ncbi:c-type cytochrome [Pelagibacterium nitratireducens]|uniref:C-type cytochrome n=1 Tax=Pelagibacterium nitratireducens TaxID=1046114 RepID=A0ABZ2HZJ9_9HYPH